MTERLVENVLIEIPKGSRNKYEYDKEKKVIKEWLRNNSKFSLWEWLYNSISPNKHQRQYR